MESNFGVMVSMVTGVIEICKQNKQSLIVTCTVKNGVCEIDDTILMSMPALSDYSGYAILTYDPTTDTWHGDKIAEKAYNVYEDFKCLYTSAQKTSKARIFDSHGESSNSGKYIRSILLNYYADCFYVDHLAIAGYFDIKSIFCNENRDATSVISSFTDLLDKCEKEGKTVGIYCDVENGVCTEGGYLFRFIPELLDYTGKAFVVFNPSTGEYSYALCEGKYSHALCGGKYEHIAETDAVGKGIYCESGVIPSELLPIYSFIPGIITGLDCDYYYINSKYIRNFQGKSLYNYIEEYRSKALKKTI